MRAYQLCQNKKSVKKHEFLPNYIKNKTLEKGHKKSLESLQGLW